MSRQKRGRHQRKEQVLKLALATILIMAASLGAFALVEHERPTSPEALKAVIVDQVSLTFPNPGFVAEATKTLEQAGYEVDYVPGDNVTVDFVSSLPAKNYDMVILRAHSARIRRADGTLTDDVTIFTGEPYDRAKYTGDQRAGFLDKARYFEVDPPVYWFGMTESFIRQKVEGSFKGARVILMGCNGLRSTGMADAFMEKGAKAFISWDDSVSIDHTDKATISLLNHLLVEKLPVETAVSATAKEVGPDPQFGGKLSLRSS
jgi:hypothetical protein